MINSRDLADLHPLVAAKARALLARCEALGIDLLVTSTYRDGEAQAKLYAQGRTAPGHIVTHARPGQSFHNWRVAFDIVPLRHGKPVWGTAGEDGALWAKVGDLGEAVGLGMGRAVAEVPRVSPLPVYGWADVGGLSRREVAVLSEMQRW